MTTRIFKDNIESMDFCDACDTVVAATDTIVESFDGQTISQIPDRKFLYQGQTPQTFKAKKLWELYEALTKQRKTYLQTLLRYLLSRVRRCILSVGKRITSK